MGKYKLFINTLRPSSLKSSFEPVFLIGALFSLSLSIAVCLIIFHIFFTFNTGLIAAMRGVFPQIMVYEGPDRNPHFLKPEKVQKIKKEIALCSGKGEAVEEIFLWDFNLSVISEPGNEDSDVVSFKSAFKAVSREHLKNSGMEGFLPGNILEQLVSNDNVIAISEDLRESLNNNDVVTDGNIILVQWESEEPLEDSDGAFDEYNEPRKLVHKIKILHEFNMLEGSFSRLVMGSRNLLELMKPGTRQPNMIGIEGLDESSLKKIRDELYERLKWDEWQKNMKEAFEDANEHEKKTELSAEEKAVIWKDFISIYKEDNPYNKDDNNLLKNAKEKYSHYAQNFQQENEEHYTFQVPYKVKTWTDTMPYKIERFIKYISWSAPVVWGLTIIPVLILIVAVFGFYVQKKNLYINLMRIFGLQVQYVGRMIFVSGLLIGMACCIAGFSFYFLFMHYFSENIAAVLNEIISLDFSSSSIFSVFNILNLSGLSLLCGLISLIPACRVYDQSPADLLIK
ncbi:MAG: hypothetical protein KJ550_03795 [Proteobacteria bacterium]|nr:hypothetical protein [Pseudomonadota bacterium]MBU4068313.1 hypothetical protein [Pseudomonadota bacterium]